MVAQKRILMHGEKEERGEEGAQNSMQRRQELTDKWRGRMGELGRQERERKDVREGGQER